MFINDKLDRALYKVTTVYFKHLPVDYLHLRQGKLWEAEEECIIHTSPNIINMIKSRTMRMEG
jgi:hypothetical protein